MMRALAFALVSAAFAGLAGYGLGRRGARRAGLTMAALLAACAAYLLVTARGMTGFDGLGRMILALFFFAPSAVGLAGGVWWGGRRRG